MERFSGSRRGRIWSMVVSQNIVTSTRLGLGLLCSLGQIFVHCKAETRQQIVGFSRSGGCKPRLCDFNKFQYASLKERRLSGVSHKLTSSWCQGGNYWMSGKFVCVIFETKYQVFKQKVKSCILFYWVSRLGPLVIANIILNVQKANELIEHNIF